MSLPAAMVRARALSLEAIARDNYRLARANYFRERAQRTPHPGFLADALYYRARWSALRECLDSADVAVALVGAA